MKKQINLTIKAHLIRGAFYLLVLLAVCAIPLALAKRNATKRSVANSVSNAESDVGSRLLPYDVRGRPNLPSTIMPYFSSAMHGRSAVGTRAARLIHSLIPNAIYMIDDGTAEDAVAFGDGLQNFESLFFNQFDVIAGQTMISTVSVAWGTPVAPDPSLNGTPITIGIWSDPNGDGDPSDAALLGQVSGTIQNAGTDTFVDYTLSPPVDVSAFTSFFVGDMTPMNNGPEVFFQGIDQNDPLHRQSWIAAMSDGSAVDFENPGNNDFIGLIDDFGIPGNWLIRADTGGGGTPTPTATASPTATATPTGTPSCTPVVINGSIDDTDPTQTDKLVRSGIPQTCPATTTCAIFGDGLLHHYDSYTFTNITGSTQCVTIDTNSTCIGVRFIFTAAYLGSFDPANICTNWIGDAGFSPNPDQAFQVEVPDGQTLVVVVSEVTADAGCPAYTLTVTGLCGGFTPSPTPTASPTPTTTATPTSTATPTGSPLCSPTVINGAIDLSDPTQTDHLNRSGVPQTCPATTTCAIAGDALLHHYDSYTFTNTTGSTQCVTIDTNSTCIGVRFIFTAAYLGSFDPANICTNWIGDSGFSPNPDQAFQVEVPDGQTLVVVVSNVTAEGMCPAYTLTVTGLCGGFTPSPTPTASPTATATASPSSTIRPTPTPRPAPSPRPRPTPAPRPSP